MKPIDITKYNYPLFPEQIANYPTQKREQSKLLVYKDKQIEDKQFADIVKYINDERLVILNDTKVFNARFLMKKDSGARIEIFCIEPYIDNTSTGLPSNQIYAKCFVGNAKKWKIEKLITTKNVEGKDITIEMSLKEKIDEHYIVKFEWDDINLNFYDITEIFGQTPLPPYIKRKPIEDDKQRYQTIYAKNQGSVAAPTAGLHFTKEILEELRQKGTAIDYLTLNVGAGTFKPVTQQNALDHNMHTEKFTVNISTLENLLKYTGKITSVGTTSLRTIESIYWIAYKAMLNNSLKDTFIDQWEVYEYQKQNNFSHSQLIQNLINLLKQNQQTKINGATKIMIVPEYEFKLVNTLITNFHQPQSTLLLLIAAFVGDNWKNIYSHALSNKYRFLSYGDSSILFR